MHGRKSLLPNHICLQSIYSNVITKSIDSDKKCSVSVGNIQHLCPTKCAFNLTFILHIKPFLITVFVEISIKVILVMKKVAEINSALYCMKHDIHNIYTD